MNTVWSTYIQNIGTLYLSRSLRFSDAFKERYVYALFYPQDEESPSRHLVSWKKQNSRRTSGSEQRNISPKFMRSTPSVPTRKPRQNCRFAWSSMDLRMSPPSISR